LWLTILICTVLSILYFNINVGLEYSWINEKHIQVYILIGLSFSSFLAAIYSLVAVGAYYMFIVRLPQAYKILKIYFNFIKIRLLEQEHERTCSIRQPIL